MSYLRIFNFVSNPKKLYISIIRLLPKFWVHNIARGTWERGRLCIWFEDDNIHPRRIFAENETSPNTDYELKWEQSCQNLKTQPAMHSGRPCCKVLCTSAQNFLVINYKINDWIK